MFFESFLWEEEKLGLISGVSFILMGVLGYAVYLQNIGWIALILMILAIIAAAGTAILFQLPRLRGMKPAVGTLLGGMMIGGAVILWVLSGVTAGGALFHEAIVFSIIGAEVVLAFFAVGFLILALYPPGTEDLAPAKAPPTRSQTRAPEKEQKNVEIDDDIFERL